MEPCPLDFVAQACMDLTETLTSAANKTEREVLITNHIKKVWPVVPIVEDFKKNLEWVNVDEPISLVQHCNEKVVVLDFWTYCCINCYHVIPDLEHLTTVYKEDHGLVVIGVHCAKFFNEKISKNILAAVQRYHIQHPVVNDADSCVWNNLGIRCWPTLLILGPNNKPLFIFTGEGHRAELVEYVGIALKYFSSQLSSSPLPISLSNHLMPVEKSMLKFPSKVAVNPFFRGRADEPFLAISDTGHHRVVLTDGSGVILRVIGGPDPGFKDGRSNEAKFDGPQGLCWLSGSVLAVCDTNNHSLRAVLLEEGTVEVLTGTGKKSLHGDQGGDCLAMQSLSSPWDVVLYKTPDLDMSVRPQHAPPNTPGAQEKESDSEPNDKDKKDERRRVLIIACAGTHQIWGLFLDTTIWWKYKTYPEGTCASIAGTGAEAARNSSYPHTAAFAQPSGLALKTGSNPEVFIADAESSSIRRMSLTTGQVSTLCGGDRNPLNLFAFGDVDDTGVEAKFQHPLCVAYNEVTKTLYVADTYNHKIKRVSVGSQRVTTLHPVLVENAEPVRFNEPSGLSVSTDGAFLYVADTNNHSVKVINLQRCVCEDFRVRYPDPKFCEPENLIQYKNDLFVNKKCGSLIIYFTVSLDVDIQNVKFTTGAPQNWHVIVRDSNNLDVTTEDFEFAGCCSSGTKLPGRVEMKLKSKTDKTHYRLYLTFHTALCDNGSVCFSHNFTIRSNILVRDSVKMIESYKITCKVNPINRESLK